MEDSLPVIVIPRRVTRAFVKANKHLIFIYSNDYFNQGCEGMAWNFVGEDNAFMVPTCYKLCLSKRYFYDHSFDTVKNYIDELFARIPNDNRPIIPMPRIGQGCSRMKELAPLCFTYLKIRIDSIKYPNIKVDYETR